MTTTLQVEDLGKMFEAFVKGLSEAGVITLVSNEAVQQPQAEAPARRQTARSNRNSSAKAVSTAQHTAGSVIEIPFGVRLDGTLTPAQQSRARQVFADLDCDLPKGTVTMRSIVKAVQDVNAALRGENSSTVRYWAVWNGPAGTGRLTDHQARLLLRSNR